ncbi:hypothetical protein ACU610_13440 [Geodermatophilus sp. URMC 61]
MQSLSPTARSWPNSPEEAREYGPVDHVVPWAAALPVPGPVGSP